MWGGGGGAGEKRALSPRHADHMRPTTHPSPHSLAHPRPGRSLDADPLLIATWGVDLAPVLLAEPPAPPLPARAPPPRPDAALYTAAASAPAVPRALLRQLLTESGAIVAAQEEEGTGLPPLAAGAAAGGDALVVRSASGGATALDILRGGHWPADDEEEPEEYDDRAWSSDGASPSSSDDDNCGRSRRPPRLGASGPHTLTAIQQMTLIGSGLPPTAAAVTPGPITSGAPPTAAVAVVAGGWLEINALSRSAGTPARPLWTAAPPLLAQAAVPLTTVTAALRGGRVVVAAADAGGGAWVADGSARAPASLPPRAARGRAAPVTLTRVAVDAVVGTPPPPPGGIHLVWAPQPGTLVAAVGSAVSSIDTRAPPDSSRSPLLTAPGVVHALASHTTIHATTWWPHAVAGAGGGWAWLGDARRPGAPLAAWRHGLASRVAGVALAPTRPDAGALLVAGSDGAVVRCGWDAGGPPTRLTPGARGPVTVDATRRSRFEVEVATPPAPSAGPPAEVVDSLRGVGGGASAHLHSTRWGAAWVPRGPASPGGLLIRTPLSGGVATAIDAVAVARTRAVARAPRPPRVQRAAATVDGGQQQKHGAHAAADHPTADVERAAGPAPTFDASRLGRLLSASVAAWSAAAPAEDMGIGGWTIPPPMAALAAAGAGATPPPRGRTPPPPPPPPLGATPAARLAARLAAVEAGTVWRARGAATAPRIVVQWAGGGPTLVRGEGVLEEEGAPPQYTNDEEEEEDDGTLAAVDAAWRAAGG